jgi:intron-binding protein aquarius
MHQLLLLLLPHYIKQPPQVSQLQRLFFKHWPQLYDLALANCAAACAPDGLRRALRQLQPDELQRLVCKQLRLVGEDDPWSQVSGRVNSNRAA